MNKLTHKQYYWFIVPYEIFAHLNIFLLGICDSKAGSILCSTQKKCDEANLKSRDFYKHSALARSTNAPQQFSLPLNCCNFPYLYQSI